MFILILSDGMKSLFTDMIFDMKGAFPNNIFGSQQNAVKKEKRVKSLCDKHKNTKQKTPRVVTKV